MPLAEAKHGSLLEKIDQLPELKPFPAIATQILKATDDPDCSPAQLIEIMKCDPSISLRLLRVANSSIYGFSGEIVSIGQAVVILGLRSVRGLVVAAAAADVFASGKSARQSKEQLWDHSLACAAVASVLSSHTNVAKELAFLAGILHDVGKLVFYDLISHEYDSVIKKTNSSNIISFESDTFGVNHQQIGNRCGSEWGLPLEINDAISFHHSPTEAEGSIELVDLISLSDSLANLWRLEGGKPSDEELSAILDRTKIQVDGDAMEELRAAAVAEYQVVKQACNA